MITLTLDTSCFEAGCKDLEQLMKMCEEGKVDLQISQETEMEIVRSTIKKLREYGEYLRLVDTLREDDVSDMTVFNNIAKEALKILSGEIDPKVAQRVVSSPEEWMKYGNKHRNDCIDVDIFALHVLSGANFFVTRDAKGFIGGGRKEKFEKKFNTKIRLLDINFIEELRLLLWA